MKQSLALSFALCAHLCVSHAQTSEWELAGEQQPSEPGLWQRPAIISYTRENGQTTGTIDADLRYVYKTGPQKSPTQSVGWQAITYSAGVFVHRSTDDSEPKNDRGFTLRAGKTLRFGAKDPTADDAFSNIKKIDFLNLSLSAKVGKTLVSKKDDAGNTSRFDKKSARLVGLIDYYLIPKTADRPQSPDFQINLAAGGYHDRLSGVGGKSGKLSGVLARARVDVAVLGLDPNAVKVSEALGFTPTVYAAAQVQKDLSDSGDRQRSRYTLYNLGVALNFARLDAGGMVPSLVLERSTGADLLTGRGKTGKTTVAFGLAF